MYAMRILHFYKTAYPDTHGGVEQVIHTLASGEAAQGHDVHVLALSTLGNSPPERIDGYMLHRAHQDVMIASTGFSRSAFRLFKTLAQEADVIHYHFPWPFMDVVYAWSRISKPCVVTYHSDIVRQKYALWLYRPIQNWFLSKMDAIVATSPPYVETSPVLQKFRAKTQVIPIGISAETYPALDQGRVVYWKKRVPEKFFLFVGVLRYYKGLHYLIEAAKEAPFPIVIVGSGPMEAELKTQVDDLGLQNVLFLGMLDDIDKIALLHMCYAFVFPSHLRSEAFGISLLEAAMCGKPMISCEIGTGTSYINLDKETGIVVPPGDPQALANAMNDLWQDPEKAIRMGQAAQARYTEDFMGQSMVDAYIEMYLKKSM